MGKVAKVTNLIIKPSMSCLIAILFAAMMFSSCATFRNLFRDRSPSGYGEIPSRPAQSMTGSQFMRLTRSMGFEERERAILSEVISGNMPEFLNKLQPINLSLKIKGAATYTGQIWVMPDYLAIGRDDDFIRIPMTPITAQMIADHFGYILPTTQLVNLIYQQATQKLTPLPLPPGKLMTTNEYYGRHQLMIEGQLGKKARSLTAGHKKDIVITNRLKSSPYQVAIYGWHRSLWKVIQPLSLVHPNTYADYSHGVRLVRKWMIVNGKELAVAEVLKNKTLAGLLSSEGVITESSLNLRTKDKRNSIYSANASEWSSYQQNF